MNNKEFINMLFSISIVFMSWIVSFVSYGLYMIYKNNKTYRQVLKNWQELEKKNKRRFDGKKLYNNPRPVEKSHYIIFFWWEVLGSIVCVGFWMYLLIS